MCRPGDAGENLTQELASRGLPALWTPVITIDFQLPALSLTHKAYDILIFISANAVRGCPENLIHSNQTRCRFITVGASTAKMLNECFGLTNIEVPEQQNSEGLLAIESLKKVKGSRIAIIKGMGGRKLLAQTLRQREAQVEEISVYRRLPKPIPEKLSTTILAASTWYAVISSVEILEQFHQYVGTKQLDVRQMHLVVVSQRIFDVAKHLNFVHIHLTKANNAAIIKTLTQHIYPL